MPNTKFLSGPGAEEPTVYGWYTKVSAPFDKKYKEQLIKYNKFMNKIFSHKTQSLFI